MKLGYEKDARHGKPGSAPKSAMDRPNARMQAQTRVATRAPGGAPEARFSDERYPSTLYPALISDHENRDSGFPESVSPNHSHHFFGTLPPASAHQQVAESAEIMRPVQCFMKRPKVLRMEARPTTLSETEIHKSIGSSFMSSSARDHGVDAKQSDNKVKVGALQIAQVQNWHKRIEARPDPFACSTDEGLVWSRSWCEINEGGTLLASGSGVPRTINLKRTFVDSVKGSMHVILEEDTRNRPHIPEKYKNEAYYLPRTGQLKLNLPPEQTHYIPPSPIFLKFEHEIEKRDWIDVLLSQGAEAGPGIRIRERGKSSMHSSPKRTYLQMGFDAAKTNRRYNGEARSRSVEPLGSDANHTISPPSFLAAERGAVNYSGAAPISQCTRECMRLTLDGQGRKEFHVQTNMKSGHVGEAWRRTPVVTAALQLPNLANWERRNQFGLHNISNDIIHMHASALYAHNASLAPMKGSTGTRASPSPSRPDLQNRNCSRPLIQNLLGKICAMLVFGTS